MWTPNGVLTYSPQANLPSPPTRMLPPPRLTWACSRRTVKNTASLYRLKHMVVSRVKTLIMMYLSQHGPYFMYADPYELCELFEQWVDQYIAQVYYDDGVFCSVMSLINIPCRAAMVWMTMMCKSYNRNADTPISTVSMRAILACIVDRF